jgi:hypothetical protein
VAKIFLEVKAKCTEVQSLTIFETNKNAAQRFAFFIYKKKKIKHCL